MAIARAMAAELCAMGLNFRRRTGSTMLEKKKTATAHTQRKGSGTHTRAAVGTPETLTTIPANRSAKTRMHTRAHTHTRTHARESRYARRGHFHCFSRNLNCQALTRQALLKHVYTYGHVFLRVFTQVLPSLHEWALCPLSYF